MHSIFTSGILKTISFSIVKLISKCLVKKIFPFEISSLLMNLQGEMIVNINFDSKDNFLDVAIQFHNHSLYDISINGISFEIPSMINRDKITNTLCNHNTSENEHIKFNLGYLESTKFSSYFNNSDSVKNVMLKIEVFCEVMGERFHRHYDIYYDLKAQIKKSNETIKVAAEILAKI